MAAYFWMPIGAIHLESPRRRRNLSGTQMAERAHPEDPAFRNRWRLSRKGLIVYPRRDQSPYLTEFNWRYSWVKRHCADKDVLDVPCGVGWGTQLITGTKSLTGVDVSFEAIAEATKRYGSKAKFQVGDMAKLEFGPETFDVLCCLEGIEHVPINVGQRFVLEAHRVLRPGGSLLVSSPYCKSGEHSGNPYHVHEYKPQEIVDLLSSRFDVVSTTERDVDRLTIVYLNCRPRG